MTDSHWDATPQVFSATTKGQRLVFVMYFVSLKGSYQPALTRSHEARPGLSGQTA